MKIGSDTKMIESTENINRGVTVTTKNDDILLYNGKYVLYADICTGGGLAFR